MQFNTLLFLLIFLPLFIFSMLLIKNNKARNIIILTFSIAFYLLNDSKYLFLLVVIVLISYLFALKVKKNKILYILYLTIVIGVLSFFKYGNYLIASIKELNILMPLGISYFIFEAISYVSDCYYSKYEPSKNILEVSSYIMFFPSISCGPILRFNNFTTYYNNEKTINYESIEGGFRLFIIGLAKKVIIADQLTIISEITFDSTTTLSTPLAWLGAVVSALVIYYDFSGYSDMAIGIGKMIGFDMGKNFDYPFVTENWPNFWRRWHISLSSWFKDYVYIPLGGSRVKTSRLIFNVLVVWTLTGVWHGSTINCIMWGLVSGISVVIWGVLRIKPNKYIGIALTDLTFIITLVIFKCGTLTNTINYFQYMFMWTGVSFNYIKVLGILHLIPVLIIACIFVTPQPLILIKKNNIVYNIFILTSLIISIIYIVGGTQQTFAYFTF